MKIAVLMGGPSAEHDVSRDSGRRVYEALHRHERLEVVIGRDGAWRIDGQQPSSFGAAMDRLARDVDVVFVALHGPYGEDGTVQGLLESFGIAYTGSGVAASSLAMDKLRTKLMYRASNLPTPDFAVVRDSGDSATVAAALDDAAAHLGLPMAVKPNANGSSVGVSFPENFGALARAVETIGSAGDVVLLERLVVGRELTCGVLDARGKPEALPVTEIIPGKDHKFFDYAAKYKPGGTREITPAPIPDALRKMVQSHAVKAHQVLGCRDMSRTDFVIDTEREPLLLETNTVPGFTETSLLPQAAASAGLDLAQLVELLVEAAHRRKTQEASVSCSGSR